MTELVFQLYCLFLAGFQLVMFPGTPVDVMPLGTGFMVACHEPSSVFVVNRAGVAEDLPGVYAEPRGLTLWNGHWAVSAGRGRSVITEERVYTLPGEPWGMSPVQWSSDTSLAVCLFTPGEVILLREGGGYTHLATVTGVKSVCAADADWDGDQDLFVSGCGSGVAVIENRNTEPVVHYIGSIGDGVKRIAVSDMDGDGFVDVAGVACAEGGAGWWKNPGNCRGSWEFIPVDETLQGPKDISAAGDSLVIASLFSPLFVSYCDGKSFPEGFTCCCTSASGTFAAGHRLGFLLIGPQDQH